MTFKNVTDVCRLCPRNKNLQCVFDKECGNICDIIFDTTGVQILPKDIVSKNICARCKNVVIKMNEFRLMALKNDRQLKEECNEYLRSASIKIPNTNVTIKTEESKQKEIKQEHNLLQKSLVITKQHTTQHTIHPTVNGLFKMYPDIKLPNTCLKLDISPCVSMKMNVVENHFRSRNLDMRKFVLLAMKSMRNAQRSSQLPKNDDNVLEDKTETNKIVNNEDVKTVEMVKPINIKMSPNKSNYAIVETAELKKGDNNQVQADKESNKMNTVTMVEPLKNIKSTLFLNPRKRKLSDNDYVENNNKSVFVESLGLEPNSKPKTNDSIELAVEKQVHICNTCNSVQYSVKELKKHQQKHLHCQFCKARFKNIIQKNEHIEKLCRIKKMMNLPNVSLEKIENNLETRKKYPNAFKEFPLIPGLESNLQADKKPKQSLTENICDIIEIMSDDEETDGRKDKSLPVQVTKNNSPPCTNQLHNGSYNNISEFNNISSSIVKPDIRIKNNQILYTLDSGKSDIQILKELLQNYELNLTKDKLIQTELPDNSSIVTNQQDFTTDLKNLKSQLYAYKILVDIKKGPFKVSYNYHSKTKKDRKLSLWNNLIPVDIKLPIPKKTHGLAKPTIPNSTASSNPGTLDQVVAVPPTNLVASSSQINAAMVPTHNSSNTTSIPATTGVPSIGEQSSNVTLNSNIPSLKQLGPCPNVTVVANNPQNYNSSVMISNTVNPYQNIPTLTPMIANPSLPTLTSITTNPSLLTLAPMTAKPKLPNLSPKIAIPNSTNNVVYSGNSVIPYSFSSTLSNVTTTLPYSPSLSTSTIVPSILLPNQTIMLPNTTEALSYITTLSSVTTAGSSMVVSAPPITTVSISAASNNNNISTVTNNVNNASESVSNLRDSSVLNPHLNAGLTAPISVQQTTVPQNAGQTPTQTAILQTPTQTAVPQSTSQTTVVQSVSQTTIPSDTATTAVSVIRVKGIWELM